MKPTDESKEMNAQIEPHEEEKKITEESEEDLTDEEMEQVAGGVYKLYFSRIRVRKRVLLFSCL